MTSSTMHAAATDCATASRSRSTPGRARRQRHDGHAELTIATDLGDDRSIVVRRLAQRPFDGAGAEERGDPALRSVRTGRLVHAPADVPQPTDEAHLLDREEADPAATDGRQDELPEAARVDGGARSAEADQPAAAGAAQLQVAIRRAVREGGGQPQLIEGDCSRGGTSRGDHAGGAYG